ncbi:MAG: nucleotidyltransferase family protein [Planctomycetes bacterium]|nr:nucleotidyltransferase family protein [Planctomycetota bacterium]
MTRPDTDEPQPQVYAVIPAAGRSRRMGTAKQLLPHGQSTVLETVIETVLAAPIDGLAVVTHSAIADELDLPEDPRFVTVINDDEATQMFDSIRLGVTALARAFQPGADAGLLVCPGDLPGLDLATLTGCLAEFRNHPDSVVVATHGDKTGHPVIVPLSMVSNAPADAEGGLAGLLRRSIHPTRRVESPNPAVLDDLNTPQDYDRLNRAD